MPSRRSVDLSPATLLHAYAQGAFPMADSRTGHVAYYTADPRAILPLDAFHIPHGLRRRLKRCPFTITRNAAFREVITACAQPRPGQHSGGDGTWINDDIIDAYCRLHDLGFAHSVEAWACPSSPSSLAPPPSSLLLGGLYGVALGGAFFGESMFSRATDASKTCLVHLVEHLRQQGFVLLDTQFANPHLTQFGLIELPAHDYLRRLQDAVTKPASFLPLAASSGS